MNKKDLEAMSVDELLAVYGRMNRLVKLKPKKRETGADGALLLNSDDPRDQEWFEDEYYKN
ncbi:hypothetical protein CH76_02060 [Lysinibacillus sp. BF-4]|uniref:hypothetical protein n=1 Tax=Lysinibacillus sp. BF-4 TaxID=1473546 RepID=UPI00050465E8|nr:hypothetical protein [Lysinibacillus sp. BF-4]KFL44603.1 hypothetical protein CH76_02060 [Lysinibacillus sp. BF-4]